DRKRSGGALGLIPPNAQGWPTAARQLLPPISVEEPRPWLAKSAILVGRGTQVGTPFTMSVVPFAGSVGQGAEYDRTTEVAPQLASVVAIAALAPPTLKVLMSPAGLSCTPMRKWVWTLRIKSTLNTMPGRSSRWMPMFITTERGER